MQSRRRMRSEQDREALETHWASMTRKLLSVNVGKFSLRLPQPQPAAVASMSASAESCVHPEQYVVSGGNQYGSWKKCQLCRTKLSYTPWSDTNRPVGKTKGKTAITYIPVVTTELPAGSKRLSKAKASPANPGQEQSVTTMALNEAMSNQTQRVAEVLTSSLSQAIGPSSKSAGLAGDPSDEHDDADAEPQHDGHDDAEHTIPDAHGSSSSARPADRGVHGSGDEGPAGRSAVSCGEVRGNETAGAVTRSTTIHLATTSGMLDQAKVSDHSALAFVSGLAETGADRHFFVSPANPTWLKSNLIQEKLSDGVIWQNEKGLFCAWGHRELEHATCFGEFNDDHCFHVTNKVKRDIRRNVRGILDDDELYRKAKSEGANEDNKQPAKGTQEPKKNDKQPAKGTPEPKKEDKQPAEGTQEPKSVTKQPASETRELDKKGKQPASETQELDKKSGEEESSSSSSPSSHRPFGPSFPLGPALMSCHGFSKKDFKVMEVFSPPGISSEATSRGFSSTSVPAFDIKCGWDFNNARHRARFWQLLRTEKPDFVSISPRCTAFSVMMNSNWDRMDEDKKKKLQAECMAMLQFSVQVACFQLEAGRTFLLEQPGGASSWACHAMKWLLEQPGTVRFLFDQCMAGLSVSEDGSLSRKTTGIATNHLGIACLLSSLQCDGSHQHVPLESGLPLKAQEYPEKMVKCIVDGLELGIQPSSSLSSMSGQSFPTIEDEDDGEEDLEDALDREVDRAGQPLAAARPLSSPLSDIQKEKIMRVHVNMGHLSKQQMLILFKAAGAKPEAMSYVKEKFQCSQCMRQKRPVEARRAAFPRTFSLNRFVGVDCFFINFQGKTRCFLNMICLGTNLQVVIWLRDYEAGSPSSLSVWKAFQDAWLRPFGSPEVVQCDGGSEFKGRYERGLEQLGCLQVVSDAASPWQNSKVERHGGWLKTKAEEELQTGSTVVGSPEDLEELLIQTAMAKNSTFQRRRFFSHADGLWSESTSSFGDSQRGWTSGSGLVRCR